MNFIPYPVFLIIQVIAALAIIASPIASGASSTTIAFLAGLGIIELIIITLSKEKKYLSFTSYIDVRITCLIVFVGALLLTFSPYLLSFVDNTALVITTTAAAAVTLLSFVFTNLTLPDQEITE